ncbi:MAG: hypothetical protein ACPLZC_06900, partial [Candidatus Bathyarchaeales archaeon]
AALLLFGMLAVVMHFSKTGGWIYVEAEDEFVDAKACVPTVVNELDYVDVTVEVYANINLNVTVYTYFCEAIYNKDGVLTLVNLWDGKYYSQSFNVLCGSMGKFGTHVRAPDVAAASKQMFMLSVEYHPQRIEDVEDLRWKQWGVRTANSTIVEIQVQNSFLIPDSVMLASAILEFPIILLLIIPNDWKAAIASKLHKKT